MAQQSRGSENGNPHTAALYPETLLRNPMEWQNLARRLAPAAERMQDEQSADAKASNGGKGGQLEGAARHPQIIGRECKHRTQNTQNVEPERRPKIRQVLPETQLKKQCRQADGSHHDQRNRTEKS